MKTLKFKTVGTPKNSKNGGPQMFTEHKTMGAAEKAKNRLEKNKIYKDFNFTIESR